MINISTSHVVSWPTPAGPAVAPVSPVTAVQPVRETGQDPPSGSGSGREGHNAFARSPATRTASAEVDATPQAAPLLPRQQGSEAADGRSEPEPAAPAAPLGQDEKTAQQMRVGAANDRQPLQAVLTTVWQASAAVVERALDRLAATETEVPGVRSDTSPDLSAVAAAQMGRRPLLPASVTQAPQERLPWPVMAPAEEAEAGPETPAGLRSVEEVVAYDEHGNSSFPPIEAGSLISQRV